MLEEHKKDFKLIQNLNISKTCLTKCHKFRISRDSKITREEFDEIRNNIDEVSKNLEISTSNKDSEFKWRIVFGISQTFIDFNAERLKIDEFDIKSLTIFDYENEIKPQLDYIKEKENQTTNDSYIVSELQKQVWSLFLKILRKDMCQPIILNIEESEIFKTKEDITNNVIAACIRKLTRDQIEECCLLK